MIPVRPAPPPLSLWCGVVVGCFPPLLWCGVVWLWVASPPSMMMTIIMIIIITIILVFLWLVVGHLLPTCLLTIMALLTVGPRSLSQLSFWCTCNRVAMGQLSQGSGLSGNTVRVIAALFVGVLFRKCLQSHGTRSS